MKNAINKPMRMGFPTGKKTVKRRPLWIWLLIGSNVVTYLWVSQKPLKQYNTEDVEAYVLPVMGAALYLKEKAAIHVSEMEEFEEKVNEISKKLDIAPDWLMAVMYAESGFDPRADNKKGSGAVGLIQFMPFTAGSMNLSTAEIRSMDAVEQLDYVCLYLQGMRKRGGNFTGLTDLYLSILYPKARGKSDGYVLFAKPGRAYHQNAGLDENRDGRVTVEDIDRRMLRKFPWAYSVN